MCVSPIFFFGLPLLQNCARSADHYGALIFIPPGSLLLNSVGGFLPYRPTADTLPLIRMKRCTRKF